MITLQEQIYSGWRDEWRSVGASSLDRKEYFFEKARKILEESGDLPDGLSPCPWIVRRNTGQEIHYLDGYSISEESLAPVADAYQSSNVLRLVFCDFVDSETISALSKEIFNRAWNNLKSIYNQIVSRQISADNLNAGHPLEGFARAIRSHLTVAINNQTKAEIRLILLTNQSSKHQIPPREETDKVTFVFEVWDISRLMGAKTHDLVVDFSKYGGIPCLKADLGSNVDIYNSYLAVFPGEVLAECYQEYREKLLEQNVRVYLQNKGKVNRGIRETLLNNPFVFFVYNNGLAITADDIVLSEDGSRIISLRNMQVVNGGQTMASIHNSWLNDGNKLKGVSVQAKLTVVNKVLGKTMVPDISRYSNTQNAVKATDLDSNGNVQRWFEMQSRKMIAPDGKYWYYERVRGQYQNAQLNLTPASKRQFREQYPAARMIDKKELARAMMVYELCPHLVARGGEKTFSGTRDAMGFGRLSELLWQQSEYYFSEEFYRQCIAKIILFVETDKIILKYCSKFSTYKASLRGYLESLLLLRMEKDGKSLNLNYIWDNQDVGQDIRRMLASVAMALSDIIEQSGQLHRVQEWLKTEAAWDSVKEKLGEVKVSYPPSSLNGPVLNVCPEYLKSRIQMVNDLGRITEDQRAVYVRYPVEFWKELYSWDAADLHFTNQQKGLVWSRIQTRKPLSDSNSKKLLKIVSQARACGWRASRDMEVKNDAAMYREGNAVEYFLSGTTAKALIVESSCDGMWLHPSLDGVKRRCPAAADIDFGGHDIGDVQVINLGDGRRLMLCYTRKTKESVSYWPLLSACLQSVRTNMMESSEEIVVPVFSNRVPVLTEYERKLVQDIIREELESIKVTIFK